MAFTMNVLTATFALLVFACAAVMDGSSTNTTRTCDGLASYQLDLKTLWSKSSFPNQYPAYRPTAQWTRLIDEEGSVVKRPTSLHIHDEPGPARAAMMNVRHNVLEECQRRPEASPAALLNEFVTPDVATQLPSERSLKRAIQRKRKHTMPVDPITANNIVVADPWRVTLDGQAWYLGDVQLNDDSGYIFTTENNLSKLQDCVLWLADGTFSAAPHQFLQLFTIHGFYRGRVFPFVVMFTTRRTQSMYNALLSRSHSGRYSLWSEGKTASANLKEFAEQGVSTGLDTESQGGRSIFDTFIGPHIPTGVGLSTVKFLVHSKYSKLSFVVRMIPSPDWFIGVDSVDLCTDAGQWKSDLTLDLHPIDAGTDRGFTFTSPNYRESKPIFTITSKHPDHPAGSFYYEDRDSLPPIAKLQLTKIAIPWTEDEATKDTVASLPDAAVVHGSSGQYYREAKVSSPVKSVPAIPASALKTPTSKSLEVNKEVQPSVNRRTIRKSRISTYRQSGNGQTLVSSSKSHTGDDQPPVDCELSAWNDWTPCSKTCGFGTRTRARTILRQPNESGQPCPILQEKQLCGGMSNCNWQYFSRSNRTLSAVSQG